MITCSFIDWKLTSRILSTTSQAGEHFKVCWSGTAGKNVGTWARSELPSSRKEVLSATFQEVLVRVTIFLPHHESQKDTFGTLRTNNRGGSVCAKGTSKFLKSSREDTKENCGLFSVHNTSPVLTRVRPWISKAEYETSLLCGTVETR